MQGKDCSPESCEHCVYADEGLFVCYYGEPKVPKAVVCDWIPTEFYHHCMTDGSSRGWKRRKKRKPH